MLATARHLGDTCFTPDAIALSVSCLFFSRGLLLYLCALRSLLFLNERAMTYYLATEISLNVYLEVLKDPEQTKF